MSVNPVPAIAPASSDSPSTPVSQPSPSPAIVPASSPSSPSSSPSESEQSSKRDALLSYLRSVFHDPDETALDIILAVCRAHYFASSKPVWVWVVGLSGSGKTDIGIRATENLPVSLSIGDISTKAFVTAKKGQSGILHRLPKMSDSSSSPSSPSSPSSSKRHGILTFKDFTTFLSQRPEDRALIAGQLREIADGYWSRWTGETSGKVWEGKVTIVAACTPELEHAWALLRKMGDRFVTLRWRDTDSADCCRRSIAQEGQEDEISSTIRRLSAAYFGPQPTFTRPPSIPSDMEESIIQMCQLSCWLREPVHRDSYTKKIDDSGPREKPMRLNKSIRAILAGNAALRSRPVQPSDLCLSWRIALDSAPLRRRQVVEIMSDGVEFELHEICEASGIPKSSAFRELEELVEIGIVDVRRFEDDHVKKAFYRLSDAFSSLKEKAVAEMSRAVRQYSPSLPTHS